MSSELYNNAIYLEETSKTSWKDIIGKGYRSCCYSTDYDKNGQVILFGFDKNDNPKTYICPWRSYVKYAVMYKTDEIDIFNRFVATKYFKSKYERDNYVKASSGLKVVECQRPEQEFLHYMFDKDVLDPTFNKQKLRIFSLDIETEISESFMKPSVAGNRINMITIHDNFTDKFYTWSLSHADVEFHDFEEKVDYLDIDSEIESFKEDPLVHYETRDRKRINDISKINVDQLKSDKSYVFKITHNHLADFQKDKFQFFEFYNDEYKMLEHFIEWWDSNHCDVVYGWNIKAYDIPYIFRRLENTLGKKYAQMLSPVGKAFAKDVNHDNERADVAADIEISIPGIFISDGLILYRDKFQVSGISLDGGFGLSNVGEHEGLGRKIEYDGTLKDLYIQDYQKFYEYNVRDVDLCQKIDMKCQMTKLARQIVSYGLCDYNQIYGSIQYLIGSLQAFSKTQMGKTMTSYLGDKKKFKSFEGAFVFPTVTGVYRDGIGVIDFASLYPSNIRAINASPETFVGKVLITYMTSTGGLWQDEENREVMFNPFSDEDSVYGKDGKPVFLNAGDKRICKLELRLLDGRIKPITLEWLRNAIKTNCIWTANNTLFLRHDIRQGVVSKWSEVFYNLRKSTKKKMLACFHKLHDPDLVLSEAEKAQLEEDEENYNTSQIALKNSINSIYGCLGTGFSPIANPDIAQSVTRQGRFANINASKFILKRFQELYGCGDGYVISTDEDRKDDTKIHCLSIGGDTDSQFIDLKCVSTFIRNKYQLKGRLRDWPKKYRRELWDTVSTFVEKEVNPFVRNLVRDYCHTENSSVLTYELEYMASDGIYESKKHYYIHKIFEEGDEVDKIKVTGIELKKAQVPKEMKKFLNDIYSGLVNDCWTEKDYEDYVNDLYQKFSKFNVNEISFWKGYSTARESIGFLQMAVGTTGIAKSCEYFNQIIDKLGLGKKYDQIRIGDKVRQVYIEKSNMYGIDTIAFKPDQWPKEFNQLFKIDYQKMFNKLILDPLKRFREAAHFRDVDPSKQVNFDIFDL